MLRDFISIHLYIFYFFLHLTCSIFGINDIPNWFFNKVSQQYLEINPSLHTIRCYYSLYEVDYLWHICLLYTEVTPAYVSDLILYLTGLVSALYLTSAFYFLCLALLASTPTLESLLPHYLQMTYYLDNYIKLQNNSWKLSYTVPLWSNYPFPLCSLEITTLFFILIV